jgi:hypothetical protein
VKVTAMETDRKSFKKMFPSLSEELECGNCKVAIAAARTDSDVIGKSLRDRFSKYDPSVVDFIRRCDTEEQAEEIIDFLEKRGEVNQEYAKELRQQLKREGLRSFGSKKQENYYFKQGGSC